MDLKVLFVCTGNICRSPMAEGLFKKLIKDNNLKCKVSSAGTGAFDNGSISQNSILVMKEIGIDISNYKSSALTDLDLKNSTYIFCMCKFHMDFICNWFPDLVEKTMLIGDLYNENNHLNNDIPDPIGGDIKDYQNVRDLINQKINEVYEFIFS